MDGDGPLQPVTLGRRQSTKQKAGWIPKDKWAKFALGLSILQFILATCLELYITIKSKQSIDSFKFSESDNLIRQNGNAITAYHALFIAAQLFQFILIGDALMQLSLVQLLATTLFNWAMWGYTIIQSLQASKWWTVDLPKASFARTIVPPIPSTHPTQSMEYVLIGVLLLFCITWVFVTWKLYYVFGWTTYKELGADVETRNVLYLYHIYILLIKFDVYFFLGFSFQFAMLVIQIPTDTNIHLGVSIPGTILLLVLAYYAVRRENKYLVYATLVAFVAGIGYLASKLYEIYVVQDKRFDASKNSITLFIALTILLSLATMTLAVMNMLKFGQGLMNKLDSAATLPGRDELYAFEVRNPQ